MNEQIVYDNLTHRIGVIYKTKKWNFKYYIEFEYDFLYFRIHPKRWASKEDDDRSRFVIIGNL